MRKNSASGYIAFAVAIGLAYVVLIFSLLWFFHADKFLDIFLSERTLSALKFSFIGATLAALISTLIAIPAAYAMSRYRFWFKGVLDVLLEIPMIVSPAALGAMILVFMNTDYGAHFQSNFFQIVFSPVGIVVAQLVTVMGISVRLIKAVIDEIPERYEQISRTLGASQWQSFKKVTLPLAFRGILASFILAWAKAFGEFGATITVAGAMPMKTETLPTSIFLRLSSADIEGTVVLIMIIISIGVLVLSTLRLVKRRSK